MSSVAPRTRILAFGSAGVLVLTGGLCTVLVGGVTGQVLTIVLASLGLGGALLLVFLEVGMSEDRERARDDVRRRKRAERSAAAGRRPWSRRWPRRPG